MAACCLSDPVSYQLPLFSRCSARWPSARTSDTSSVFRPRNFIPTAPSLECPFPGIRLRGSRQRSGSPHQGAFLQQHVGYKTPQVLPVPLSPRDLPPLDLTPDVTIWHQVHVSFLICLAPGFFPPGCGQGFCFVLFRADCQHREQCPPHTRTQLTSSCGINNITKETALTSYTKWCSK